MIKLIATAESIGQAKKLIDIGIDEIVIGEEVFGLRLPGYFSIEEMKEVIDYAHLNKKEVIIAMNAILHNEQIEQARPFLKKIKAIGADQIMVGDTGLIQILKEKEYYLPYLYNASVVMTSAGQVNFWAKFGAQRAFVASEVPFVELKDMLKESQIPLVYQVYGATCIHQSRRRLLNNYFNYIQKDTQELTDRELFLSEPNKKDSHYSIYTDQHGTHIFANKDLNLLEYLPALAKEEQTHWYLDGLFTPEEDFNQIASQFLRVKELIEKNQVTSEGIELHSVAVKHYHTKNRELGTGFFLYEADQVQ
ncbi:peptidase U32 family protein [Facklamia miroungae]|uniref:Collagenase-like protease, PrtC family n=1 Tax=Facklamia miroungae TaxID=120956 RepID=A0A1G7RK22_9LACT|nr:peptidase U32 family protein [Facklamia miroungae]NKZ29385.1 U32 family peptidase [Facklamia miroungae]SDG11087.1 Collagenase-like protease, PrtC family [Facklamia miroungae]